MKKRTKILIGISVGLFGSILLINGLYDKKEKHPRMDDIQMLEETTAEETTTKQTTTTTRTTTKKVVKTTKKKTTKKVVNKKVKTANKQDYINYAKEYGNLNDTQLNCLIWLWDRESGWNPNSVNKSSGACGIPQALPCNKIAKQQGSNDWKAQIRWGINYINYRYKKPCSAWNHFKNKHWY